MYSVEYCKNKIELNKLCLECLEHLENENQFDYETNNRDAINILVSLQYAQYGAPFSISKGEKYNYDDAKRYFLDNIASYSEKIDNMEMMERATKATENSSYNAKISARAAIISIVISVISLIITIIFKCCSY